MRFAVQSHTASGGKNSLTIVETTAIISQALPPGSTNMQVSLYDMRRNVAELRLQLQKMRQLQVQNQEMVRTMMKKAEQEISSKMTEMVKNLEDPVQRQRVMVEQERQKYLQDEEQIVLKLSDLESFVEDVKKDSSCTRGVTLKDVEDRAFVLRQIGEAVSNLKGEFPYLQNKMRAVLRVEVEAVRFLKEEPHKLDSLLKRIRNMTDALSALRSEKVTETEIIQSKEEKSQVYLQSAPIEPGATVEAQTTSVKSEVVPLSAGVKVLHVQSSPVLMQQSQHSSALVNHAFTSNTQSSHLVDSSANHQSSSTAAPATPEHTPTAQPTQLNNGSSGQSLFIEEIQHVSYRNRAVSIEEAERKFEEKRQNLDHYNGKEFEKMLEEAQANIMKSIPSLEMPPQTSKLESLEKSEVNEGGQESEQENDKLIKSPPPPPPRRMYPLGSSLSTSWTSDWKDSKDLEDVPPPPPPKTIKPEMESPVKTSQVDEEEEEGERIMAELQAFQKCSVVEINSKVQYEPPKSEVHERDYRTAGLALPKEKKVSCIISKESVSPESPKLVESKEDKWKIQSIPSSAPISSQIRQVEKVVANEQSTYSLFIGRDQPSSKDSEESNKEIKNEELVNLGIYKFHNKENLKHLSSTMQEVVNGGTDHKISESKSTFVKVSSVESQDSPVGSSPTQEQGMPYLDLGQTVVLRQKNTRRTTSQQSEDIESPTISSPEPRSPADNIAFIITNTQVQVLSTGEVQDIVNRKGGEVQTVSVDKENVKIPSNNSDLQDPVECTDKKPVIIIFDEPMDIKSAYKRLSTIFEECDDDLEKIMSEAKIDEEEEEEEEEDKEPICLSTQRKKG
ncbi:unnamed protein product [Ranitomeya imitator]|uniref:Uncharacterized protein n=1 Tax=Ranitomeya imitator TaxID=111125 RepID=A0ABN9LA69_9NEOB|nr:unnamed protein product [Ranitomeya imitator]